MRRQLLPNGQKKPKQKPRGISKLRLQDPSIPNPLTPHQFKPGQSGNPGGFSKSTKVSNAVLDECSRIVDEQGTTRAGILAKNLLDRAEKDSTELERVLRITEPELAAKNFPSGGLGLSVETDDVSVVFQKLGL